ncbi:MAG: hypothetical protein L0211_21995 [Planctomycetaceae bacterium]|nr:hypothetical protein [Planctomycetaceae bacterium]
MSRFRTTSVCLFLAIAAAAGRLALAEQPQAPEELPRLAPPADHYLGGLSCASASCHGRQEENGQAGSVSRREFIVWLEHDPHARAARTLSGAKFQRILNIVSSGRADGQPDAAVHLRCAKCHDPEGIRSASEKGSGVFGGNRLPIMEADGSPKTPDPLKADPLTTRPVARGIGCETCHGPAKNWIAVHYQHGVTRERLASLGMIDTKNLVVRAERCAGCHVGDGERDMNHDMIAAGHPPLRFELSAYHDLIRQKHWPAAERVRTPDFKVRLWAAGQVAAARSSLALLESRAKRAAAGERLAPWPEFAEYDCFACHQRLRPAAGLSSVALKGARPGMPGWQPWNLALAHRLLSDDSAGNAFAAIGRQMNASLAGDPAMAGQLAAAARRSIEEHPLRAALARDDADAFTTARVLALVEPAIRADQSWAETCQQLLALRAGDLLARDRLLTLQPPAGLASVTSGREEFRDVPVDEWDRDWRSVAAALRFGSADFEWPAFDWEGLGVREGSSTPPASAEQIAAALARLAEELRQRSESTAP